MKPGRLPANIEYTVSDIASLFKKIINGLPGGLLGSLEVFDAIRAILMRLEQYPDLSDRDMTALRAKLIAFAILTSNSAPRVYLIQGVLGFIAYVANEAEKERTVWNSGTHTDDGDPTNKISHELMGFQALGVCLGPLLLSDLMDEVAVQGEAAESEPRTSTESTKMAKKKRLPIVNNKMNKDSHLAAQVDRANLAASMMQSLLMIWKDVVIQLRNIYATNKPMTRLNDDNLVQRLDKHTESRLTLKNSDEEMKVLNYLRGRILPDDFPEGAHMKEKVKIKARSPMPRIARKALHDGQLDRSWFPSEAEASHPKVHHDRPVKSPKARAIVYPVGQTETDRTLPQAQRDDYGLKRGREQLHSGTDVDHMTMGQILPPREASSRHSSDSSQHRLSTTQERTPRRARARSSPSETPEEVDRDPPENGKPLSSLHSHSQSFSKPLPASTRWPPPSSVRAPARERLDSPSHQGSSPGIKFIRPHPTPEPSADPKTTHKIQSTEDEASTIRKHSLNCAHARNKSDSSETVEFRQLAGNAKEREKANSASIDTVGPSFMNPLPSLLPPLEDPFITFTALTPTKDALIRKPVNEIGRARQSESLPSSQIKPTTPQADSTSFASLDEDTAIVKQRALSGSALPQIVNRVDTADAKQDYQIISSRPLSAFTANALQRLQSAQQESPTPQRIVTGNISFESPSHSNTKLDAPLASDNTIKRSVSFNATLYTEITRLKKQFEQKNEELKATRRSLDAARATREEGIGEDASKRTSWSKGTLNGKVRELEKEKDHWRKRAEWAEKQLAGMGVLSVEVARVKPKSASQDPRDQE